MSNFIYAQGFNYLLNYLCFQYKLFLWLQTFISNYVLDSFTQMCCLRLNSSLTSFRASYFHKWAHEKPRGHPGHLLPALSSISGPSSLYLHCPIFLGAIYPLHAHCHDAGPSDHPLSSGLTQNPSNWPSWVTSFQPVTFSECRFDHQLRL